MANWELEPFVFYAMRKVVLLVGVREAFNQQPMPHTEVVVEVREPPQPPRPPVVKPEWCEAPSAYAQRIIDQLIDYVVQVRACWRGAGAGAGVLGCLGGVGVMVGALARALIGCTT